MKAKDRLVSLVKWVLLLVGVPLILYGVVGEGVYSVAPTAAGICIIARGRSLILKLLGVLLVVFACMLLITGMSGRYRPKTKVVVDAVNVKNIIRHVEAYRSIRGAFPARLSQLSEMGGQTPPSYFASPRGGGELDPAEGPLWLLIREPYPGPRCKISNWSEVDDGDYLYLRPLNDAPAGTIIVITRPGLLYKNALNVGYLSGEVMTLSRMVWKNDAEVLRVLRELGIPQS